LHCPDANRHFLDLAAALVAALVIVLALIPLMVMHET
jgi:hypothetical protein